MDVIVYLEKKRMWAEQNSEDQARLGNETSSAWWQGRAMSYKDMRGALESGIVTPEGIEKLDLSRINE